ncbi:MAG TPA: hypothetical protein VGM07_12685 [Stellaceae bacterium]
MWWRDDDAAAPSGRLDRLLEIAGDVPVALAVIPAEAELGLPARLGAAASRLGAFLPVTVLQHGWRHANHAPGPKKSEFPAERPDTSVAGELAAGRARLAALFGARALSVLAPPWNRLDRRFLPLLAGCGIRAVSRLGARRAAWPSPGVFEANVHVDLVAWKAGRGFIGEGAALAGLLGHLRARRTGAADGSEPSGILTHHLVQDEAAGTFLGRLIGLAAGHPAVRWLAGGEVFSPALGPPEASGAALEARP